MLVRLISNLSLLFIAQASLAFQPRDSDVFGDNGYFMDLSIRVIFILK